MKKLVFTLLSVLGFVYAQGPVSSVGSGCALEFDGVSNYVRVPDGPIWDFQSFTVEAWINNYHLIGNTQERIINHQQNANISWGLELFGDNYASDPGENNLTFHIGNGSTWINCVVNSVPILLNTWYHVAGVYDYVSNTMYVYINGILVQTCLGPAGGRYIGINAAVDIGKSSQSNDFFFYGQIDEVRVWNRVLTETEIREMMCKKLTGTEPGLVGYWDFNDCGGTTALDRSGNGNDGTLY